MEGNADNFKMHRSTSIRLRKRRDQAKKEFLRDRRSGEFGYSSKPEGWSYVSFPNPQNEHQLQRSGPVSMGMGHQNGLPHFTGGGAKSLCFIPSLGDTAQPTSYHQVDQTSRGAMTDTEDCVRSSRRRRRGGKEDREKKLWRKSAIGIGELERSRNIVYKDFGMIDKPDHVEAFSEINIASQKQSRVRRNQPVVTSENRAGLRQESCGQAFLSPTYEPFSLPVTVRDFEKQNEQFPLLKGMLWQKKERFFSRWKERFFILTPKHIQCFEKSPTHSNDSALFQVQLSKIEKMDLTEKKGYLTIALSVHKEGKILLRSSLGIREWFLVIKRCCKSSVEHASTEEFWSGRLQRESDNIDSWLLSRQGLGTRPAHHTSTPSIRHGSVYNGSVPTIYQMDAGQTNNQHDIWSGPDSRQQIYSLPVTRNNTQKHHGRPKSCIETSNPWYLQKQSNTKNKCDPISEDSGNSSLSASIESSRRRDKKSKSFLKRH